MKTIEHMEGLKLCQHPGETWGIALANTLACLGVAASLAEEMAIVSSIMGDQAVWHRGTLLTGWSR